MSDIIKVQDSRRIFIDTLIELAEQDPRIVLIVPDVGFNYINSFQEKFPDRFFNLGVTEQSTLMIATGMALSGLKPYVYSMINFVLFRPYEMVRNGVVHHNADVKLLGVKGSSGYKFLGFSHNMTSDHEDTDACEALGLDWITPVETTEFPDQVRRCIISTHQSSKPCYIRL